VAHYRCLVFDPDDKARDFTSVEAASDADALRQVQRYTPPTETMPLIEVWRDGRVIGRLTFDRLS
jgi:hypothetical protein